MIASDTSNIEIQKISNISPNVDVNIYKLNTSPNKLLPVLVFYHGGGWMLGSSKAYERICKSISKKANCIVASVDYRLAPEHKFPAAYSDAIGSYEWIYKNAHNFGGDNALLYIAGDSAGGNLAWNVTMSRISKKQKLPNAQALIYPVLKADSNELSQISADKNILIRFIGARIFNFFLRNYFNENEYFINEISSSENANIQKNLPKTLFITAALDPLTPLIKKTACRFMDNNTEVNHLHYPYTMHGFMNFTRFSKSAIEVVDEISKLICAK